MLLSSVFKFGGAALADGPGIRRAVEIVRAHLEREGSGLDAGLDAGTGASDMTAKPPGGPGESPPPAENRLLVVVSAHAGVTDLLETVAQAAAEGHLEADRVRIRHRTLLSQLGLDPELLDRHLRELYQILGRIQETGRVAPEERDYVLSFGERMSARIVARTLTEAGIPATPVDAWDLGLVTDSRHGEARPLEGLETAIRQALATVPGVPVVTGFLAKDEAGNLTTLGRNGSDLTASILAAAVGAGEIQYWKTVGGILTADPRLVPEARVIERLSYSEAAEFALHGAEVLHPGAVEPALRAQMRVRVRSVLTPDEPGTLLEPDGEARASTGGRAPVGLATRSGLVRLVLDSGGTQDGGQRRALLAELFAALERHGVDPAAAQVSAAELGIVVAPNTHEIATTLAGGSGSATANLAASGPRGLAGVLEDFGGRAHLERDLALVALVGRDEGSGPRQFQASLEALAAENIPVEQAVFAAGALSQKFVVAEKDRAPAARALHAHWFQTHKTEPVQT